MSTETSTASAPRGARFRSPGLQGHQSLADLQRALALWDRATGQSFLLGQLHHIIARRLLELERFDEALPHLDEAASAFARTLPQEHPLLAKIWTGRALAALGMGDATAAEGHARKALQVHTETAEAVEQGRTRLVLSKALWRDEARRDEARRRAREAVTHLERTTASTVLEEARTWLHQVKSSRPESRRMEPSSSPK